MPKTSGTYDVLTDDRLSAQLTALWDCETLEDLRAYVMSATTRPKGQEQDRRECIAQRAFLLAAQACGPVGDEATPADGPLVLPPEI